MNQTDLQGETERALRALTCTNCANKVPLRANGRHVCDCGDSECCTDTRPCTSLHAELLPLFNAGVAGAYAAAAKACDDAFTEAMCDRKLGIEACLQAALAAIRALTPADARQASQPKFESQTVDSIRERFADKVADYGRPTRAIYDDMFQEVAVAIASAEARARLEEARKWKPFKCFDVSHHPLRSPMCKTCQQMARWEERIAELEAAARTPDSTKEPE